jgi:hypothetical protein
MMVVPGVKEHYEEVDAKITATVESIQKPITN